MESLFYKARVKLQLKDRISHRLYNFEVKDIDDKPVMYIYRNGNLLEIMEIYKVGITKDFDKYICEYFESLFTGGSRPLLLEYWIEPKEV